MAPDSDVVELLTVGIDVGSATFHLSVSRVVLERRTQELSTRYDVVAREALVTSPVSFTPYLPSGQIDATAVDAAVRQFYSEGEVDPEEIDTGVVLLTGSALLRPNARALAERLAGRTGKFVCAAAGHHFEAALAAHGSGAVARSRETQDPVVSLDVGGATTKLALVSGGEVRATAAVAAGSRLLAWDPGRRLVRVEQTALPFAEPLGVAAEVGQVIELRQIEAVGDRMAAVVVAQLDPRAGAGAGVAPAAKTDKAGLLLTEPFPVPSRPFEIVASGGVAEYFGASGADLGERGDHGDRGDPGERGDHGDLGPYLARALLSRLEEAGFGTRLRVGEHRIRATVVGASQFSTQVSGSTVSVDAAALPLHHVPVVRPSLDLGGAADLVPDEVASSFVAALRQRFSGQDVPGTLAVSLRWGGEPSHARLRGLAAGLVAGQRTSGVELLVVAVDTDVASSLGRIMATELGVARRRALCLDGLELADLDYVDVGRPVEPAKVVPVVVKSLLFDAAGSSPARRARPGSTIAAGHVPRPIESQGEPT